MLPGESSKDSLDQWVKAYRADLVEQHSLITWKDEDGAVYELLLARHPSVDGCLRVFERRNTVNQMLAHDTLARLLFPVMN